MGGGQRGIIAQAMVSNTATAMYRTTLKKAYCQCPITDVQRLTECYTGCVSNEKTLMFVSTAEHGLKYSLLLQLIALLAWFVTTLPG